MSLWMRKSLRSRRVIVAMLRGAAIVSLLVVLCASMGCIGRRPANPAATQPVTAVDPATGEVDYWLAQPASAEVSGGDFQKLWDTSEAVARQYLFNIDLRDYRRGLLKTEATVSKQFFEFWRKDAGTAKDVRENSLGGIRRTVYFQFTRNADASYTVAPKVVVERESRVDPKYRTEIEEATVYWYALRRDTALELNLAAALERKLKSSGG